MNYFDTVRLIESLQGEPHVTYPEGTLDYPQTERVISLVRSQATLNFYTPEPDTVRFGNLVLTGQEEIGGDRHMAKVYRRYERLPGKKEVTLVEHDAEARTDIWRVEWTERRTVPPPAVGGKISIDTGSGIIVGAIVIDHGQTPLDGSRQKLWVLACKLPTPRFERVSLGYTFPAIFRDLGGAWSTDTDFSFPPPWLGVHFSYLSPRSVTITGRRELTWTLGAPASVPQVFNVFTNAAMSRAFPAISNKTVHGAFSRLEITGDGASAVIENFPASVPATYDKNQTLIAQVQSRTWRGPIFLTEVLKVREAKPL